MKLNLTVLTLFFIATFILHASDKPEKLRKDDIPRNEKQMWARIDAMQDEVEANLLSHDQRFLDELELARKEVATLMLNSESDKKDKKAVQELRQRTWTFWTRTVSEVEVEDVKEYNLNTALGQRAAVVAPQRTTQFESFQPERPARMALRPPTISEQPSGDIIFTRTNSVHSDGTPVYRDQYGNEPDPQVLPSYILAREQEQSEQSFAVKREGFGYVKFGFNSPRPVRPYGPANGLANGYPKKGQGYVGSGRTTSASSGRHK